MRSRQFLLDVSYAGAASGEPSGGRLQGGSNERCTMLESDGVASIRDVGGRHVD